MIKISVVITVFNLEKIIVKALESICMQTYKNFELIIIDDESTDKSVEVISDYLVDKNINYKIVSQKNTGVSGARNRGIEESEGDYIYFLDGDDYIHKDTLKEFANEIEMTNADILYCGYSTVDEKGNILAKVDNKLRHLMTGKEMALNMILAKEYINMITGVYRLSTIKNNNIKFDINRKYAEDFAFTIKCLLASDRVKPIEGNLAYYVQWEGSSTHTLSLKRFDSYYSHLETVEYIKENYNQHKYKDIIKAMEEYRIPTSIISIFSDFSKSRLFSNEINEFIKSKEVKKYLKNFKIKDFNKSNIKYYILAKGIVCFPKYIKRYYN
ncbi:MAG: glycosyltransferase [Clostridium sp.]|nr:glycosyltransferase [Clostridium sp.]